MKLGILLPVIGVTLLILAIPYSIVGIVTGVNQLEEGIIYGGISVYFGIIGVVAGFMMTAIGAIKVFKR